MLLNEKTNTHNVQIEKEVDEAIKAAKKSMQQFIEIPSVLIKDTMMKGMKGVSDIIYRLMKQYDH